MYINGDGNLDLIVGTPHTDGQAGGSGSGALVIFGSTSSLSATIDLNDIVANGSNNTCILLGISAYDQTGRAVSSGDINNDGKSDIIVGAPYVDINDIDDAGQIYVVFGASSFPAIFELSTLNGNNGFVINGAAAYDNIGDVSLAGDVNNDGIIDLVVGSCVDAYSVKSNDK